MPHAISAYPEAVIAAFSLRDPLFEACRRQEPIEFNFLAQRQRVERYDRVVRPYEKGERREKCSGTEPPFTSNENCSWQPCHIGLLLHFIAFSRHGLRTVGAWGRRRTIAFGFFRQVDGKRRVSLQPSIKG